jgi:dolichol-phosphate mannosyltransferase
MSTYVDVTDRTGAHAAAAPALSVIVPLHNEAPNVLPLVQQIFQALPKQREQLEVLLVDDASTDDTWQQILEARKTFPAIRPLRHKRQAGQSAALWTGFRASRGSVLATLDGDLQNDPADLAPMLERLRDYDMVCGARTKRADNFVRRFSSRIARAARRLALHADFADTGCNVRVFKRELVETLPAFDGIHRFMPILAQNAGARVLEVPVLHHPRTAGLSKYGVWNRLPRGIRDLVMVRLYLKRQLRLPPVETPPLENDVKSR